MRRPSVEKKKPSCGMIRSEPRAQAIVRTVLSEVLSRKMTTVATTIAASRNFPASQFTTKLRRGIGRADTS